MMPFVEELLLVASGSLAASLVAKATLIAALGLIGARLARRNRAAVRHAILAAAFGVLLLLPVASMVTPPVRVALPVALQVHAVLPPLAGSIGPILPAAPPDARFSIAPQTSRLSRLSLSALLIAGWIAGGLLSLLPVLLGLWRVRWLRRSGRPWVNAQSLVDRLAHDAGIHRHVEVLLHQAAPGPMTCGIVHPVIALSPDARTWRIEDLTRAMVHELEHVRRGDWLSQCLVRAVCAIYWFHPLVWIARRQLALEAERSCDDAVLGRSEATAYAHQLVSLARRLSTAAKTPLLAMVNRADLAVRVGAVLDSRQRRGRVGALPVAVAFATAAALVLATSPLRIVAAQSAPATPEFEAVSVKLLDANMRGSHSHSQTDPKRLSLQETTHSLIIRAYGITNGQLGGEPDWFKTSLYSIDAVTAAPTAPEQMMLMLRRVLADRFNLKLRQEDRDLPVVALEVGTGGPKFKDLKPGQDPKDEPALPGAVARSFYSMQELSDALNNGGSLSQDRPVIDRTHLTGSYNMQLVTELDAQTDAFGHRTVQFPNLFRDIQSQLGLKLVADRVRMPYFVVEKASAPAPN